MGRRRSPLPAVETTAEKSVRVLTGSGTESEVRFGASPNRRADGPTGHALTAAEPAGDPAASRTLRERTFRLRQVGADVVVFVLIAVAAFAIWPVRLGGATSYIIVKGTSMEPKFHTGDLAVLRKQDSYRKGDIVAYRIPGRSAGAGHLVVHRIIGRSHGGYLMQGDNRSTPDSWYPKPTDVLGKFRLLVPLPGIQFWALMPWVCCAAIGIAVAWMLWPRRAESEPTEPDHDHSRTDPVGRAFAEPPSPTSVPVGARRLRRLEREATRREGTTGARRPVPRRSRAHAPN